MYSYNYIDIFIWYL